MKKQVLIKPIISEKSETLSENLNQYSFVVDQRANKVEIKKAIEDMYSVSVDSINTMVMPAKAKSRNTRSGILRDRKPSYKKAIVTLQDGDMIDLFGDI
jgi:large subunit ribosomal protein L23